jgi:hypothetical protein
LFRVEGNLDQDLQIDAVVHGFVPPVMSGPRTVSVSLNSVPLGEWSFTDEAPVIKSLFVPRGLMHPGANTLKFEDPHAMSPRQAGLNSTDNRIISFGLHTLRIRSTNHR